MTPFDTFRFFLSMKMHFTNENYDAFEYNFAVKATIESFNKRKDKFRFQSLAKDHKDSEIRDIFIANFIADKKWSLFDSKTMHRYNRFKAHKDSRTYHFTNELKLLYKSLEDDGKSFLDMFSSENGIPLILERYMANDISLDTFVIMDKIYPFIDKTSDTIIGKELCMIPKKYAPFVKVDLDKFIDIEAKLRKDYF